MVRETICLKKSQSRICGKGVGLGVIPSDSLESQSYEFIETAHIEPYYGVGNDCRKFPSNRLDSFCENRKKSKNGCFWPFLGYFWLCFSHSSHTIFMLLRMQCFWAYPFGLEMTVQNFTKIV